MESMRALKRRLSDIVYRTMLDDAVTHTPGDQRTGPGGHRGNVSISSATGSHPHTSASEKSLPGPVTTNPRTPLPTAFLTQRGAMCVQALAPDGPGHPMMVS